MPAAAHAEDNRPASGGAVANARASAAAPVRDGDGIPDQLDAEQRAGYRAVFAAIRAERWLDAQIQLDNRAYNLKCMDSITGEWYYPHVWEWRPYQWTGGNRKVKPKYKIFKCKSEYKVSISSATWTARESSYTYSTGAKLAGIGLRVKQTNSGSHKLTFTPDGTAKLCGSNNYPIYARQVKEV